MKYNGTKILEDSYSITSDGAGNPLSYYDGYSYTLTWSEGRNLDSLTYSGNTTQYRYDADGLRTKKIKSDGSYINYFYAEGTLAGEAHYSSAGVAQYYLKFAYDESGSPAAFGYWGAGATSWDIYYYVKNLQGDVIAIYSESTGTQVASYSYDSWGNVISSSGIMAAVNPLTYRGYYRDSESWFYYLNTRYYDPAVGRFISPDDPSLIGANGGLISFNLFAYCLNNPVNRIDKEGDFSFILTAGLVGAVVAGVTQIVTNFIEGNKWSDGVLAAAIGGAVYNMAIIVSGGRTAVAAYSSAFAEAVVNETLSYAKEGKKFSTENIKQSASRLLVDTIKHGTEYFIAGKVSEAVIPKSILNYANPDRISDFFTGIVGRTVIKQTIVQGAAIVTEKKIIKPFSKEFLFGY